MIQKKIKFQWIMIAIIMGASFFFFSCAGENERGFRKTLWAKIDKEKSNENWVKEQGNWFNPFFTQGMSKPYRLKDNY